MLRSWIEHRYNHNTFYEFTLYFPPSLLILPFCFQFRCDLKNKNPLAGGRSIIKGKSGQTNIPTSENLK